MDSSQVKGGWELGETMEESGVRESYKEAGVLGG
jgi:NADH pyrophosphatase NudC (nudix superfamily)